VRAFPSTAWAGGCLYAPTQRRFCYLALLALPLYLHHPARAWRCLLRRPRAAAPSSWYWRVADGGVALRRWDHAGGYHRPPRSCWRVRGVGTCFSRLYPACAVPASFFLPFRTSWPRSSAPAAACMYTLILTGYYILCCNAATTILAGRHFMRLWAAGAIRGASLWRHLVQFPRGVRCGGMTSVRCTRNGSFTCDDLA